MIRVGGGNQARAETAAMLASGRQVREFELAALPKDAPSAGASAQARPATATGMIRAVDQATSGAR